LRQCPFVNYNGSDNEWVRLDGGEEPSFAMLIYIVKPELEASGYTQFYL